MFRNKTPRRAVLLAPAGLSAFTAVASASTTLPPRKPGFWVTTLNMHMVMPNMPAGAAAAMGGGAPMVTALCTDHSIDALEARHLAGNNCKSIDIEGGGDTYTITSVCKGYSDAPMTTHVTLNIVSPEEVLMHSTTNSTGMNGTMDGDSKWTGACPAGVVPGDVGHMVNGSFMKLTNIKDMPQTPQ